jgi:hypothetical protein
VAGLTQKIDALVVRLELVAAPDGGPTDADRLARVEARLASLEKHLTPDARCCGNRPILADLVYELSALQTEVWALADPARPAEAEV